MQENNNKGLHKMFKPVLWSRGWSRIILMKWSMAPAPVPTAPVHVDCTAVEQEFITK
jgi:hypothetical protein